MAEFGAQVHAWLDAANAYFGQLNDLEKYGWLAVALGLVLVVTGVVLLFW